MERKGEDIFLDDEEQALTGLPSPLRIEDIDVIGLTERSRQLQGELEALQAADDDDITSAERGYIVAGGNRIMKHKKATDTILGFWMSDANV